MTLAQKISEGTVTQSKVILHEVKEMIGEFTNIMSQDIPYKIYLHTVCTAKGQKKEENFEHRSFGAMMVQMIAPLARRSTRQLQGNGIFRGFERGYTAIASDFERRAIAKGDSKPGNMCDALEVQEANLQSFFLGGSENPSFAKGASHIKYGQTLSHKLSRNGQTTANPVISTYCMFGPRNIGQRHIHWHRIVVDNMSAKSASAYLKRGFASDAGLPPHEEIGMPSLSPTMTEGNIVKWRVKEGDKVSAGDVLCEIETDKATLDMESMEEGFVAKILLGDGTKEIKVGEVIAITVEEQEDIAKFKDYTPSGQGAAKEEASVEAASKEKSSPPPPPKEDTPSSAETPKTEKAAEVFQAEDRIFASPIARKMAEDHKVPISSIKGTGPNGRIVKADIEDYLASSVKPAKPSVSPITTLDYTDIPHSQIRKVTASRLLLSKQTIPHYYLTVDTRVDKLMELRSRLNAIQEASGGKRISVNDFVIKVHVLQLLLCIVEQKCHNLYQSSNLFGELHCAWIKT
ncbi:hypothetical protein KI387_001375, partial [Taxus chinensis]